MKESAKTFSQPALEPYYDADGRQRYCWTTWHDLFLIHRGYPTVRTCLSGTFLAICETTFEYTADHLFAWFLNRLGTAYDVKRWKISDGYWLVFLAPIVIVYWIVLSIAVIIVSIPLCIPLICVLFSMPIANIWKIFEVIGDVLNNKKEERQ